MILPTKHVSLENSYLGGGMTVLKALDRPQTLVQLWKSVCRSPNVANTHRFYKILDLLYMLGVVNFSKSKIQRVK